jgi:two-component system chemotaxis response regulator CheB
MGGTVIAQDETAEFFGMPGAAIETGVVDFILPLNEIGGAILSLVQAEYAS